MMKKFDWLKVRRDKDALRARNAGLSFAEKLRQLDRLRERSQAMKAGVPIDSSRAAGRTRSAVARRKK
ncbi:MAG TPA: hypothetical protein VHE78_06365 [Gemmatimonadaceae bacterium]|nr:hypothetical protein [Gemmatimonadaceae bacterium]